MRFKIVLSVQNETYGNVLPVSYQFELSSCIHKKVTEGGDLYKEWLKLNGFLQEKSLKHKLFSISNFYIPKIRVEVDRLHVLARKIQLWISFLPERGTKEFVENIFLGQTLLIGDKKTQVELLVESINEIPKQNFTNTLDYLSLSPIVVSNVRSNKSVEYIGPDDPTYQQSLLYNLLDKYQHFYGKEFPYEPVIKFELLSEPKRKGIFIKRFTEDETKIIGYMYKFRLEVHPILQQILYNTGIGDKVGLGFGCVEVLK